jgi:hypothetical protein
VQPVPDGAVLRKDRSEAIPVKRPGRFYTSAQNS